MKRKLFRTFEITAGGGSISIDVEDVNSFYTIAGSDVTLTANISINPTEDQNGKLIFIYCSQKVILNGGGGGLSNNSMTVFGSSWDANDRDYIENVLFVCKYETGAAAWDVVMLEEVLIADGSITSAMLQDGAVDLDALTDLTQGSIWTGQTDDRPDELDASGNGYVLVGDGTDVNSVEMSGDATIANDGEVTIADNAVDNDKLANITRGSIKTGGVDNAPTDLVAKTDGYIVGGDGTDVGSFAVAGDLTAVSDGTDMVFSVVKGTSTTASGITSGVTCMKAIKEDELKELLNTDENNLFSINKGDIVAAIVGHIKTASGIVGTIDVGFDNAAGGGSSVSDGLLKEVDSNTTGGFASTSETGSQLEYGYWIAEGDGFITITSSADLSESSIVGGLVLYYISA